LIANLAMLDTSAERCNRNLYQDGFLRNEKIHHRALALFVLSQFCRRKQRLGQGFNRHDCSSTLRKRYTERQRRHIGIGRPGVLSMSQLTPRYPFSQFGRAGSTVEWAWQLGAEVWPENGDPRTLSLGIVPGSLRAVSEAPEMEGWGTPMQLPPVLAGRERLRVNRKRPALFQQVGTSKS
jgi:hypothetical protein